MENVKVNNPGIKGETFHLKLNASQFSGSDQFLVNGAPMRVKKVYPLTWWKKILMRFGWKYHSMDLEIVTQELSEVWQNQMGGFIGGHSCNGLWDCRTSEEKLRYENEKNKFIPPGI